jgi:phospholipase C
MLYDEWGGFFDHVHPPIVPDDRRSPDSENDFGQTGFRVPAIVASPRARPSAVDHSRADHTSVLRFLEWRFLGAPARGPGGDRHWWLTRRDRHAHNLGTALGATRPDPELGFDVDLALPEGGPGCPFPTLGATPAPPGSASGASAEWEADQELESLTAPPYTELSAPPWILP